MLSPVIELFMQSTLRLVAVENVGPVTEELDKLPRILVPPVLTDSDLFQPGRNVAGFASVEERGFSSAGDHHAFAFERGSHAVVSRAYAALCEQRFEQFRVRGFAPTGCDGVVSTEKGAANAVSGARLAVSDKVSN